MPCSGTQSVTHLHSVNRGRWGRWYEEQNAGQEVNTREGHEEGGVVQSDKPCTFVSENDKKWFIAAIYSASQFSVFIFLLLLRTAGFRLFVPMNTWITTLSFESLNLWSCCSWHCCNFLFMLLLHCALCALFLHKMYSINGKHIIALM